MRIALILAALALSACATTPRETRAPDGPARFVTPKGVPASPQLRLYADCLAQSTSAGTFDRENGLIRFTCSGAPAQAFFEGLAAWSAQIGSEHTDASRTWRTTQKMKTSLSGLDHCWRVTTGDPTYGCTLVFNAGAFVQGE